MEKQQAINLIETVFDANFSDENFEKFIIQLFNNFDTNKATPVQAGNYVYEPYRNHIKSFKRIGQYTDPNSDLLDVLTVKVQSGHKLERTRTALRNFAIEYLKRKNDSRDSLLIAFFSDDYPDWRLSFIKLEYKTEKDTKGKIKVKQEITSARRYSFLVGKNEPSHTAKKQFLPLLIDSDNNPTIEQLENSFNIEKVTKEFFEQYKTLFLKLNDELESLLKKDLLISRDFKEKGIETTAFAKKLLGQIVFLYFIQKKGWLGVPKNKGFGYGNKKFLKALFEDAVKNNKNYFNDYLEPLFYEALAVHRTSVDPSYYKRFDCRIPFLNGGLFEPIKDYDWQNTEIIIPNELFSNTKVTKEKDIGTGILNVFDRFNFTVKEDEPLEKEIAVDPEMLGKVFENLLEVKDRKSKGAFYTPREIVHYMCQESLINYLDTAVNNNSVFQELGTKQLDALGNRGKNQQNLIIEHKNISIPKKDIESFIKHSHLVVEDTRKDRNKKSYQLPNTIKTYAEKLDTALTDIKVCDPAIGSGAFPVGMLNEIVRARMALIQYLDIQESDESRSPYHLKRECIQNSLYGVDIDASAIDIAKLRLWLSLVVDEDSIQDIEPLPNLDYKIVRGNSLLSVNTQDAFIRVALEQIEPLKNEYFSETNKTKKENLRKQIDRTFKVALRNAKMPEDTFEFSFHFSEVWHYKNGFDVVIGNPPYLRIQEIQKNNSAFAEILKKIYLSATGSFDIYACFVEKAMALINNNGNTAYILPHKFFQATFGKGLRKEISKKNMLRKIVNFGSSQVFESATTYTCLLFLSKRNDSFKYAELSSNASLNNINSLFDTIDNSTSFESNKLAVSIISNNTISEYEWNFSAGKKGEILAKIKQQPCILKDVCDKIFQGIATSADKIYFLEHIEEKNDTVKTYSKSLDTEVEIEKGFVKPLLKGADVHRYAVLKPKIWCVFPYKIKDSKAILYTQKEIKKQFPLAWKYLLDNKKDLEARERGRMKHEQFYAYIYPKNLIEFEQEKIITPEISHGCNLTYDTNSIYHNTKCYSFVFKKNINESPKYFLALLNSNVLWYFLSNTGYILRGGYFVFKTNYLMPFPIPTVPPIEQQKVFIKLVNNILNKKAHNEDTLKLDTEIDARVAHLYNLTEDEYKIVLEGTEDTFRITALNFYRDIKKGILK